LISINLTYRFSKILLIFHLDKSTLNETRTISLINSGDDTLIVTQYRSPIYYHINNFDAPGKIAPKDSITFDIDFSQVQSGTYIDYLVISDQCNGFDTLNLQGIKDGIPLTATNKFLNFHQY